MSLSQQLQIERLPHTAILQEEVQLLKRASPSLGMLKDANKQFQPFTDSTYHIQVFPDRKSNIRALYYSLLYIIYESDQAELARNVEQRLKSHVYSPVVKLDQYRLLEIEPRFRNLYDNLSLKKVFVEFVHGLSYARGQGKVMKMLNQYPIMDFVLLLILRSIYHLDYAQPWSLAEPLSTFKLAQCLSRRLAVNISFPEAAKCVINKGTVIFTEDCRGCNILRQNQNARFSELWYSTEDSLPVSEYLEDDVDPQTGENTPQFKDFPNVKIDKNPAHSQFSLRVSAGSDAFVLGDMDLAEETQTEIAQRVGGKLFQIPLKPDMIRHEESLQELRDSPRFKVSDDTPNCQSPRRRPFMKHQRCHSQKTPKTESIEQDLCDGLTSSKVLNMMSPHIKKQINEKKRSSILHLLGSLQSTEQGKVYPPVAKLSLSASQKGYGDRLVQTERVANCQYEVNSKKELEWSFINHYSNQPQNKAKPELAKYFQAQSANNVNNYINIPHPSPICQQNLRNTYSASQRPAFQRRESEKVYQQHSTICPAMRLFNSAKHM